MSGPLLLVLGDSLAFHGPQRAEPADDPRLWPNVAAAALGGRSELVAGFGWTARDAWWALTRDPRVWALLPRIDALFLGVGSMDSLPSPLPTPLREGLRYLRPDGLCRMTRAVTAVAIRRWAASSGVALIDLAAVAGEHVRSGSGNPDGMHWGWQAHAAVGAAVATALHTVLGRCG